MRHGKAVCVFLSATFALWLCHANATAQTWEQTFGGTGEDGGASVQQTLDGGFIVAGSTDSVGAGREDVLLIKTDADGNEVWSNTFGGLEDDYGNSVQQTVDGGYIVAGSTRSSGAGQTDFYLIKTDAGGNEVWSNTFGGTEYDHAISVQQTVDGGFVLVGLTASFGAGNDDVWLVKTDADGNEVWSNTFGGFNYDRGYSVQQTSDGGFIVAGETGATLVARGDLWLIKTDASGDEVWNTIHGGVNGDVGYSVQQTVDAGYIVAGYTRPAGVSRGQDVWLIKTDGVGNEVWSSTFGGREDEWGRSVQQTADGGFIVTGVTETFGAGGRDVYLIKTDPDGNEEWSKTFGGTELDWGLSVRQAADGTFVVAGSTRSFGAANGLDVYLIRYDATPALPDIKANGSDGPVTLVVGKPLSVTISLDAGGQIGENADWWVVVNTPFGWFYYDLPTWRPGILPTYQGALFSLADLPVFSSPSGLPTGVYSFYFVVDMSMNGVPDGEMYFDGVRVSIVR